MRSKGRLSDTISLPKGGTIRIEVNHFVLEDLPQIMDQAKHDNRILAVAYALEREQTGDVVLVTKDLNLRIKADVLGIKAEDFYSDKVNYHKLYKGIGDLEITQDEFHAFFREKAILLNGHLKEGHPNQFFVLRNFLSPSQSALARLYKNQLCALNHQEASCFGIKPRNKEQKFAIELLMDDDIKIATLVGKAGTGKTLLALSVGLEKVLEQGVFSRLLITRPIVPMGDDLGYLPGSKEEKLRPWMQPIYDNLEYLLCNCADKSDIIKDYVEKEILQMEPLTYIRGRSIPNQFIICDEAQNLTPHMIKTLITRVGEGSKIVFTGDPEQIDHPYLDASSNGLSYIVEKLKDEEITGHITLLKGERSIVAELGSRLL